jgi:RNA polymerase sigma factor (sigma-70 family)
MDTPQDDSAVEALSDDALRKRFSCNDWKKELDYVADEQLFRLLRRAHEAKNQSRVGLISEALSRRILVRARNFAQRSGIYPRHISDLREASHEIAQEIWADILASPSDAAQAEKAFGKYFKFRAIDFLRRSLAKKRAPQERLDASESDEDEGEDSTTPEKILSGKQEYKRIRQRLHTILSKQEFSTFVMLTDLEMPIKDIAKALGVTVRSVSTYKKWAYLKLKTEFMQ